MKDFTQAGLHPGSSARERSPAMSWWMLAVLCALYIMSFVDRFIMTLLVTPIQDDLGFSDFQISLILGPAFAVFYALFGLPLGWAADRYPRKWVVFLGVIAWSAAAAGSGLARSFSGMVFCRAFVGVGEASLSQSAYSLLADAFPRRRLTLALSIYQTSAKLGSAIAFAVGALAIAVASHLTAQTESVWSGFKAWQVVLILTGAPGVLLAFLVFTFTEPPRRQERKAVVDSDHLIAYLRTRRRLIGLMLFGFTMVTISGYSLVSWLPTYPEPQGQGRQPEPPNH